MADSAHDPKLPRRSFMARLGASIAALSGASAMSLTPANAQSAGEPDWKPARHSQDDWLDALPGKHRFFFDATTPLGAGDALQFTNNFLYASKSG